MRSPGTGGKTFLKGGGETGALIASMDWSEHPLGPPESWPQSLQTALSICLSSRQSLILFWGPELYSLYNDAFVAISGDKHPASMGQPGRVMWAEIWDVVGPMLQGVLTGGEATWEHDQLLVVNRFGFPEETYFTYSYSAIRDETRGVGGVFTATTETTGRVLTARRLSTLKELAGAATATSPLEACRSAVKIIEGNRRDIPFLEVHLPAQKGGFGAVPGMASGRGCELGTASCGTGRRRFCSGALARASRKSLPSAGGPRGE